jgi:thioredoxin 1
MSELPESRIATVDGTNFQEQVLNAELPVLIDVSTRWCPPCKVAHPVVERIAAAHAGRLKVVAIDGDESPDLVARLGVRGFPTFIGFRGGELTQRVAGFGGKAALERFAADLVAPGLK